MPGRRPGGAVVARTVGAAGAPGPRGAGETVDAAALKPADPAGSTPAPRTTPTNAQPQEAAMTPTDNRFYRERKPGAVDEAVMFTMTVHRGMTDREREIAETAAKAAVRWTKREVAEAIKSLCPDAD